MEAVRFDLDANGDWGYLTVDRREVHNAIDGETLSAISGVLDDLPPTVRLVIISGAGDRAFLSGADIGAMSEMSVEEAGRFAAQGGALLRRLETYPALIGALVDGFALGGGTEFILACDVVVATPRAVFGLPEVKLGIFPGWGGTQRLVRIVGPQRGLPYLLTGRTFAPDEAITMGILSAVVEDRQAGEEWFAEFARDLRRTSPLAVREAKRLAREGLDLPIDAGLSAETDAWTRQFDTPDRQAGFQAFRDRKIAQWRS